MICESEMKLLLVILCICLVQICFGSPYSDSDSDSTIDETETEWQQEIRDVASAKFLDDFVFIFKKMENNTFARTALFDLIWMLKITVPRHENVTIDVENVKEFHSLLNMQRASNVAWSEVRCIDHVKLLQLILSKNVPPERYNGIINLYFALAHSNATSREIENAVSYLYRNETTETTFLNLPDPTAADCPDFYRRYSDAIDKLDYMVDIQTLVIEDAISIRNKFPCNFNVLEFVEHFVYLMTRLQGDKLEISACTVEENVRNRTPPEDQSINLELVEYILPTRLINETFSGIMNFIKVTKVGDTPRKEIQKSLEYLYGDVATTECS